MTRSYSLQDFLTSSDYKDFRETQFTPVAWGLVFRYRPPSTRTVSHISLETNPPRVEDTSILVVDRYKPGTLRHGKLVVPGGRVKKSDGGFGGFRDAGIREVEEETGLNVRDANVWTLYEDPWKQPVIMRRPGIIGVYVPTNSSNPVLYVRYDDGEAYIGKVIDLKPIPEDRMPKENTESDARNPRFMPLQEALAQRARFTEAMQLLLERIERHNLPEGEKFFPDDLILECKGSELSRYLRVTNFED